MSTTFNRRFDRSATPLLLKEFGEPIIYRPRAGGSREITAIVEREPPAIFDAAGNVVLPQFVIRVRNSCRTGIDSSEIDTGGDQVSFVGKIGEVIPKTFSVGQVLSQGGGVLRFSVM